MKIAVFGLGYVGTSTAATLARDGHSIIGIDVAGSKVQAILEACSPIVENKLDQLVADAVRDGRLSATTNAAEAVDGSEMAFVCVGTPSLQNGGIDLRSLESVIREIGAALREKTEAYTVVIRSTVLPGTVRSVVIPALEVSSGRQVGDGLEVLYHPEFMREGSSVDDFQDPPFVIVGELCPEASRGLLALYEGVEAPTFCTTFEVAEAVKYACNAFHALKVTFANEIGQLSKQLGVDGREVMAILCADDKLNISPKYLRPGFAFGGSCLPKDLRALVSAARGADVNVPLLDAILRSNAQLVERIVQSVERSGRRRIGMVGLAFKPGTDDLRESPFVEVAERLIGKGRKIHIYDELVWQSRLSGKNLAHVERHLPHLSDLLVDSLAALDGVQLVIVGHPVAANWIERWTLDGKIVVDLVGVGDVGALDGYRGIAW